MSPCPSDRIFILLRDLVPPKGPPHGTSPDVGVTPRHTLDVLKPLASFDKLILNVLYRDRPLPSLSHMNTVSFLFLVSDWSGYERDHIFNTCVTTSVFRTPDLGWKP